ncbi:MAG: hypothetical protein AAB776_03385 [Patescibacteria group bacterium]
MLKSFLIGLTLLAGVVIGGQSVQAITLDAGLEDAGGTGAGYDTDQELPVVVGQIIKAAIGILGVLFLVLTIYAGFTWMTAGGDEKKVTMAKSTLARAVIGLVIVLAAYSITTFIVGRIEFATQGGL